MMPYAGNLGSRLGVLTGMLLAFFALITTAVSGDALEDEEDEMRRRRLMAQPWYLRGFQIGDNILWISPLSLAILFVSVYFLLSQWSGRSIFCDASHILLEEQTEDAKAQLVDMKKKISNDPVLFAKYAKKYSTCPSKAGGGRLGKFNKGDMAPPFDKACFSGINKVGEVIGPVQTQFGWHLIFIHDRQLPDELGLSQGK